MSSQTKRIPKNSIVIIIKFDSKDQVKNMLQDPNYQEAYSKIISQALIRNGKSEIFKSFSS